MNKTPISEHLPHVPCLINRSRRRLMGAVAVSVLMPVLAACSIDLPGGPGPKLYTLTPKSTFDQAMPFVDRQLLVEQPVAASGLNTARIVLKPNPYQLDYFASVAWADRATSMVQTLLVESFENTKKIVSVGRETTGLRADYILKNELREFQAEYFDRSINAAPDIRVRISATLIKMPERAIVSRFEEEQIVTARDGRFDSVVQAFDDALGKVLSEIVEETLVEMAR